MHIQPTYGRTRSPRIQALALVPAAMLVVMVLAQLYTYEDFAVSLSLILPTNDYRLVKVIAGGVVFFELLALPYLLRMFLTPLMRVLSAVVGAVTVLFWLLLALTNAHAVNVPLLGDVLALHGGIVPFVWSLVMVVCMSLVIQSDTTVK